MIKLANFIHNIQLRPAYNLNVSRSQSLVNLITSFISQSSILQRSLSVVSVILLLCLRLSNIPLLIWYLVIRSYCVIFFIFSVFHSGSKVIILTPHFKLSLQVVDVIEYCQKYGNKCII